MGLRFVFGLLATSAFLVACGDPKTVTCVGNSCALPPPPDPCAYQNGGCDDRTLCKTTEDNKAVCGACPDGFSGTGATACVDIDECVTDNGGCDALTRCTNTVGDRTCGRCPLGYTGNGATGCTDIDECKTDNGRCDPLTTCTNTVGGRTCSDCPTGYTGNGSGRCLDVNECKVDNGGCGPDIVCTNTAGGHTCGDCPAGYTGSTATGCTDIDECASENGGCDAVTTCTNTPGGRTCGACPSGYTGRSETGCVDVDECATDRGGCDALTTCTNTPGGRTCSACPVGYAGTGATRCTDLDECATNNGGCDSHALCTNTPGGHTCGACPSGYTGTGTTTCQDVDECHTANGGCDPKTACTNTPGGRTCSACPAGYSGTGEAGCQDIDECKVANGGCDRLTACTNTPGGRTCAACPDGYSGNGADGCKDVDECATDNGGCGIQGDCINTPGSFNCGRCPRGYRETGNGACVDIDECGTNNGGCGAPAYVTCVNKIGSFLCNDHDECAVDNGGCDPATEQCVNNYGAPHACADLNECLTNNGGCGPAAHVTCTNQIGAPRTCSDRDECTDGSAHCANDATCANTNGGFTCECKAGFYGNGVTCAPIPPVCAGDSCTVQLLDDTSFYLRQARMQDGAITLVPDTAGFDASGSFTVPAGVTSLTVYALGGGGGSNGDFNASGSGGGAAQKTFAVTPGQVIPFTVGGGGVGAPYGGATRGTDSVVTIDGASVVGGGGGAAGEPGGVGTGGDIVATGGQGLTRAPGRRGEDVHGVCAGGSGGGAIDAGEKNHVVGGYGGCYPAGGGGQGAPQFPVTSPGQHGEGYGGGGGGGGNYGGRGGDGGGGFVMFSWASAAPVYPTQVVGVAVTADAQLDTSSWGGVASVIPDDVVVAGAPAYAVSFDGRKSFAVYGDKGWSTIVSTRPADLLEDIPGNGIWQHQTGQGWADCELNDPLACLQEAFEANPLNRMLGETLAGLTQAQWFEPGGFVPGTLDFAIGLHTNQQSVSAALRGLSVVRALGFCDTDNGGCDPNATCALAGPGIRTCTCNAGFVGNGLNCAEPDICDGNADCGPHASCVKDSDTTYHCDCNPGFTPDAGECVLVCGINTVALAGSVRDGNGDLLGPTKNGNSLGMMIHAQSQNGASDSNITPAGDIAFCVPNGKIDVSLANFGYGFFNRSDLPNPRIPYYVWNITPSLEWNPNDGQLDLELPATFPITVHVTSGGEPVVGATVSSDTHLTSTPFILRPATGTTTTADFFLGNATTDAHGNATLYTWPTDGQTFKVYASTSIHGVSLSTVQEGVPTVEGTIVTMELPAPPQLLTGTLKDTNGNPIKHVGNSLSLMMHAGNSDGAADANVDDDGNFSFYVPSGSVTVALANYGYGFFNRNDVPNPLIPAYVYNISPAAPIVWKADEGPLDLTLPAVIPVTVHVTSGGTPVEGASVSSDTTLTSLPFTLRAATQTVTTAQFKAGNATTDANGNAVLMVWPTAGQTFTVYASKGFNGVSLTTQVTGVATVQGTIDVALPDPPQLLTGTLTDLDGNPIKGTGNGLSLMIHAQNADGASESNVDVNGAFSFYVTAGDVEVSLANYGYGFFNRNDLPNPLVPGYIWNISPTITWTHDDGPLELTLPSVVAISVHVSTGGQPVPGAGVSSVTALTSLPFTLTPGTVTTAQYMAGNATTDANGNATLYVWETNGQTFTVDAGGTFSGVSIHGATSGVAADGDPHAVEIVLAP